MINSKMNYSRWLESSKIDENTRDILKNMSDEEIQESFYKNLDFGTAGLRGILGPGINRMNIFIVRKASEAFARYLLATKKDIIDGGVVIAHDKCIHSIDTWT